MRLESLAEQQGRIASGVAFTSQATTPLWQAEQTAQKVQSNVYGFARIDSGVLLGFNGSSQRCLAGREEGYGQERNWSRVGRRDC